MCPAGVSQVRNGPVSANPSPLAPLGAGGKSRFQSDAFALDRRSPSPRGFITGSRSDLKRCARFSSLFDRCFSRRTDAAVPFLARAPDNLYSPPVRFRLQKNTAILVTVAVAAALFGVLVGSVVTFGFSRGSRKEAPAARPAALNVNATVFEKFGLVIAERAVTKRYKADYDETLATYVLGSLSDLPLIRAYEKNGVFSPEKLSGLRSDGQAIEQQLRETKAIFQVVAVFANTGDEEAAIAKVEFSLPSNRGEPWVQTFSDPPIIVEGNSTKAKVFAIEMPLFLLLADRLKKAAKSLAGEGEESAPSFKDDQEQLAAQIAAKVDIQPFVNLREKMQITVYDQEAREFRSEADISRVLTFVETQIPPEFKKQKEAKDVPKNSPKPKPSPSRAPMGRAN